MKTIVNGCFDCFHDGHKQLLKFAIRTSLHKSNDFFGRLLILVNSDFSMINYKNLKPKDNENLRLKNIKDFIKKFDFDDLRETFKIFNSEEELSSLIDEFQPDFIIKGSDYTDVSKIVGFDKWPIIIKPRGRDINGKDISSTQIRKSSKGKYSAIKKIPEPSRKEILDYSIKRSEEMLSGKERR